MTMHLSGSYSFIDPYTDAKIVLHYDQAYKSFWSLNSAGGDVSDYMQFSYPGISDMGGGLEDLRIDSSLHVTGDYYSGGDGLPLVFHKLPSFYISLTPPHIYVNASGTPEFSSHYDIESGKFVCNFKATSSPGQNFIIRDLKSGNVLAIGTFDANGIGELKNVKITEGDKIQLCVQRNGSDNDLLAGQVISIGHATSNQALAHRAILDAEALERHFDDIPHDATPSYLTRGEIIDWASRQLTADQADIMDFMSTFMTKGHSLFGIAAGASLKLTDTELEHFIDAQAGDLHSAKSISQGRWGVEANPHSTIGIFAPIYEELVSESKNGLQILKRSDGSNSNFTLGTAALFVFFEKYLSPSSFNQLNTSDDKMIAILLKRLSHLGHINKYVNHVLGLLHVDIGSHGANKNLAAGGSSAPDPSAPHTMPVVIPNQNTPVHSQPITGWLPLTMNVIDPSSQLLTLGSYMSVEVYKDMVYKLRLTQEQIIEKAIQQFVASSMTQIVHVVVNYLIKPGVMSLYGINNRHDIANLTTVLEGVMYDIQGDPVNQHPDGNYLGSLFRLVTELNERGRGPASVNEMTVYILGLIVGVKVPVDKTFEQAIDIVYARSLSWINRNSIVIKRVMSSFPGVSAETIQEGIVWAGNFIDQN